MLRRPDEQRPCREAGTVPTMSRPASCLLAASRGTARRPGLVALAIVPAPSRAPVATRPCPAGRASAWPCPRLRPLGQLPLGGVAAQRALLQRREVGEADLEVDPAAVCHEPSAATSCLTSCEAGGRELLAGRVVAVEHRAAGSRRTARCCAAGCAALELPEQRSTRMTFMRTLLRAAAVGRQRDRSVRIPDSRRADGAAHQRQQGIDPAHARSDRPMSSTIWSAIAANATKALGPVVAARSLGCCRCSCSLDAPASWAAELPLLGGILVGLVAFARARGRGAGARGGLDRAGRSA